MDVISFDVECTTRLEKDKGFPGSPFYEDNKLLDWGCGSGEGHTWQPVFALSGDYVTAVHNGVFDIHWIRRYWMDMSTSEFQKHGQLWDTQIAHHLLSGCVDTFASLDDVAARELGPDEQKFFEVSQIIKEGRIEEIDETSLRDYLKQDLDLTRKIAIKQMERMTPAMRNLCFLLSEATKVIEEMEWNGLTLDKETAFDRLNRLQTDINLLSDAVSTVHLDGLPITPKNISAKLFGGKVTHVTREADGVYKTGKRAGTPKFKRVTKEIEFPALYNPEAVGAEKLKTGWYRVDENVLETLSEKIWSGLAENVLAIRKREKIANTYLRPMLLQCEWTRDGRIHHSINPAATKTGRYSSSNPNGQNMPMMDPSNPHLNVKDLIVSRFGEDGVIIEADYKQLEVVALAAITYDLTLIDDLKNGRDIHAETGKAVFGSSMTEQERRIVKTINFGLIYGGGAAALSKQAGVTEELAKKCIDAFYNRYTKVKKSFEITKSNIQRRGYDPTSNVFQLTSTTGRMWAIPAVPSRHGKGPAVEPAYTALRNYPVQGTATGDLVPLMLTAVFHALLNQDNFFNRKCLMINTVHDSIIFDCHKEVLANALPIIHDVLEDAPRYMEEVLDFDGFTFNELSLKVDISYGRSWGEAKTKYNRGEPLDLAA